MTEPSRSSVRAGVDPYGNSLPIPRASSGEPKRTTGSAAALNQREKARVLPVTGRPLQAATPIPPGADKADAVYRLSQQSEPPKKKIRPPQVEVEPTLANLLQQKAFPTLGIPLSDTIAIAGQVLEQLTVLAKMNRVHRSVDQKGIAYDQAKKKAVLLGKIDLLPRYVPSGIYQNAPIRSPEDILGHPADPKVDVWSLGVSLYNLFTGSRLFPQAPWTTDEQENTDLLYQMAVKIGKPKAEFILKGADWQQCYNSGSDGLHYRISPSMQIERYLAPFKKRPALTSDVFLAAAKANKEDERVAGQLYEFIMTLVAYERPTAEEALVLWKQLFAQKPSSGPPEEKHRQLNLLWNQQKA